jgi:hypothetical protein
MTKRTAGGSTDPKARIVGAVYLFYFLTAILGAVLTPGAQSDIVGHEPQFRAGIAVGLIAIGLYIAVTALLYNLFMTVDRRVALFAAFVSLAGCAIQAFASVFQLVPLLVLTGYANAFTGVQLHALSRLFLELNVEANQIAIVFFGAFDIAIGYLIVKSTFLPRVLGVLMSIAGAGWLAFLVPPLALDFMTPIAILGFVAELALMLWLVVRGVNVERWTLQTRLE